jgi:hypothetical protein
MKQFPTITELQTCTMMCWVATPCGLVYVSQKQTVSTFCPKEGHSIFLRNAGIYVRVHTALEPSTPPSSSPRKLQISYQFVNLQCSNYVTTLCRLRTFCGNTERLMFTIVAYSNVLTILHPLGENEETQ